MHPIWRRFWLMALRRESWVVILVAVALSVATVALSRRPAASPAPAQGEYFTVGALPTAQPTQPEPFHAHDNTPPGVFYPIAYMEQHPRRWVGKTVQIEGGLNDSCCILGDAVFVGGPIPYVPHNTAVPWAFLGDGNDVTDLLPLAPGTPRLPPEDHGFWSGTYWRVHLAWWSHCGALGFGKSSCLVADHLYLLHL